MDIQINSSFVKKLLAIRFSVGGIVYLFCKIIFGLFLIYILICPSKLFAENREPEIPLESDEVLIVLYVKDLGTCEIPTAIRGQDAYLPVVDVFNFLKIRTLPANGFDMISGFFIDEKNIYQIDRVNSLIIYQGKTYNLKPADFIVTETNLYLNAKYFEQIFGLQYKFNFRTLTISLKSDLELPAIREMRLEQMHLNFDRLKGLMKADTTVSKQFSLFHFGTADWLISSYQQVNGLKFTRYNLGLGAVIAGGEFNSLLLYNTNQPFTEKQQYYLWRYANNENKILKQFMIGKIAPQSVSSIFNPVVGVQITNAPTVNRKSFGSYTINNYTKPNWTVELYVNNVLIDYVKADASGFFTFDVPLIYGSTDVTLRYYGPFGEELTSKQSFSIPFNFLPHKQLEYKISSGVVEDNNNSLYSQARFNYGLTNFITIGGGLEYLSSITTSKRFSFFNTSVRLASNMLFSGEYADGVRYKGLLSYHAPSNYQVELYYSKYTLGQQVVKLNYTEERRMMISKPFLLLKTPVLARFSLNQNLIQPMNTDLPTTKYTVPEFSLSGSMRGISLNITTTAFIINKINTSFFSDISLSTNLRGGVIFTPQIRFDYNLNQISLVKYSFEKSFNKYGVVNASYQHNLTSQLTLYQISYRYDFSFARAGATAIQSNITTSFTEFASGSLIYQPQINYTDVNVNTNVGRGGLIFLPFLDINNDGKKNINEPKVNGLNVLLSGGGILKSNKDTTIVITGLEPFTNSFVELDANSLENMAWRIVKPKMNIAIESNKLKLIEVPIAIVGEVSGTVYIKKKNDERGLGRILVEFYDEDSVFINKTLTEFDGYFSFLGLLPGNFYAKINSEQLNKLQLTSYPSLIPFTIKSDIDGDVVDGLKFILKSKINASERTASETIPLKLENLSKPVLDQEISTIKSPKISETDNNSIVLDDKNRVDTLKQVNQQGEINRITAPQNVDSLKTLLALAEKKRTDSLNKADSTNIVSNTNKQNTKNVTDELQTDVSENPFKLTESKLQNGKSMFAAQAIAHSQLADAKATQSKLSKSFKQPVVIVNEGGLYKVRINALSTREEAMTLIPILKNKGYEDAFVVSSPQNKALPEKLTEKPVTIEKGNFEIQVRAHSELSSAKATQSILSNFSKKPLIIVHEGGLYKVRLSNFDTREDAIKILPELVEKGFTDSYIIDSNLDKGKTKSTITTLPANKEWASQDSLFEILKGNSKHQRVLLPQELAKLENVLVNKNEVIKRSKYGDQTIYSVQIASTKNGLSQNTLAVVYKLKTAVESYTNKTNGLTIYYTGYHKSYSAANNMKKELVKNGFKDSFIIVIYKGKIMSVKDYNTLKE